MYYLADAALFTSKNLKKAEKLQVKFIRIMPGVSTFAKKLITDTYNKLDKLREVTVDLRKGTTLYKVNDFTGNFDGTEIKCLACYNENLKESKKGKRKKQVIKELEKTEKIIKYYKTRKFACKKDIEIEIELLKTKKLDTIKYHDISYEIEEKIKKRKGRPSKTERVEEVEDKKKKTEEIIDKDCIFIVASNDLEIKGDDILFEYKKQISVEVKFKQLKSPQFVNALFLSTNKRIESLIYLMLISLMILSVAEHVVRRGLKNDYDYIIGPGKIKMNTPILKAIYGVFYSVQIKK